MTIPLLRSRARQDLLKGSGLAAAEFLRTLSRTFDQTEITKSGRKMSLTRGLSFAVRRLLRVPADHRKVLFVGNGGSAAIASHLALDFWNAGRIMATAFNDAALLTCMSNDRGYEQVFAEPVRRMASKGDVLCAISSSGKSRNILNAVRAAKDKGCDVITLSGFEKNNPLRALGLLNFYVPSSSYGIVEAAHLSLLTGILEEIMDTRPSSSRVVELPA